MTEALVAAVAVVGALACLNLLLTAGLIRRIREYDEEFARQAPGPSPMTATLPAPGTPVPAFTATAMDGTTVTERRLVAGTSAVGFFSTHCPPCREQLPAFVRAVTGVDRDRVFIVLVDDGTDPTALSHFVDTARPAGVVFVESPLGTIANAFASHTMPTMLAVTDGTIVSSAHSAAALALPVQV